MVEEENYSPDNGAHLTAGESEELEIDNVTQGGSQGNPADTCRLVSYAVYPLGSATYTATYPIGSPLLAASLFGDLAAALREHGPATLDEHSVIFAALTD